MNRRGQVFVGFVLLLPLIIMMFAYVIDNGVLLISKSKLDEVCKTAITYALNDRSKDIEDIEEYINLNSDTVDIDIILDEDVQIKLTMEVDAIFGNAIGISKYRVSSYYIGYIVDGEIILRDVEKE